MKTLLENILANEKIMKRINKVRSGEKPKTDSWTETTLSLIVRDCLEGTGIVDDCGQYDIKVVEEALNKIIK